MVATIHPFEEAGLGNAPFRVTGVYQKWYQPVPEVPRRPGGTCDLCGNSIANCFQILSSDGKRHIVGSECVQKTDDKFIINQARITARRAERARLIEELKTILDENFEAISNLPSPDYALWTRTNPPDWFAPRDRNGTPRVFFGRFGTYGGEYVSGLEVCSRTFNEIYNYATWLRAILPPTKRERSLAELKRVRKYLVENGIIPKGVKP